MKNKANIITFSSRGFGRTQEGILASLERRLAELHRLSPDLICFPEEVLISGGDKNNPRWEENNAAALALMRRYAALYRTNIVCNLEEAAPDYPGKRYNTSYVIDRAGGIIGKYRKRYITYRAIAGDGIPGEKFAVVDTDIGRIGLMICFDIGWREDWQRLADMGADIVVWPAAYHGGNLINAYAAIHMYYVITSVWNGESRIVNPLGDDIAEGHQWDSFVSGTIYPTGEVFHFDNHFDHLPRLREAYGDRIFVQVEGKGNTFHLGVNDPALSVAEIKKTFGMQSYADYHRQYGEENARLRVQYPED